MRKTLVVMLMAALCSGAVSAQAPMPPPLPTNPGGGIRARLAEKAGGYVYQQTDGKALKVCIGNKAVDPVAISAAVAGIKEYVLIKVEVVEGSFSPEALSDKTAGAWVFVEDNDANPALLVAPEEAWARVNVRKLKIDNPDADKFNVRVAKEIWRGAAIAMGGSDGQIQPSLMRSIKNLKMLDVAPAMPTPDTFNKMMSFAKDRDFGIVKRATYRTACKQGWAPAPTNDLQKAIWDKSHEIPDSPLKIEYDPKKGK